MFKRLKERVNNWINSTERFPTENLYNLLFKQTYPLTSQKDIDITRELQLSKRPLQVAVIRVGNGICDNNKIQTILDLCRDLSDSEELLPVHDGCNQIIILFFRDTLWDEQVKQILDDIQKNFLESWPASKLYISIGNIEQADENSPSPWQRSYRIALGLLDYRYIKQKGKVISYADIIERRKIYPEEVTFRFDMLKKYMDENEPEMLHKWLIDIDSFLEGDDLSMMGIRYHLTLEIVVNIVSIFTELGYEAEDFIASPENIIIDVLSHETPHDLTVWTNDFLEKSYVILHTLKSKTD